MVGVRSEDATGAAVSVRQDKLPAAPFSAESLLASVALPGDYPAAEKPQHVKTEPLECQLKVSSLHTWYCTVRAQHNIPPARASGSFAHSALLHVVLRMF